MQSTRAHECTPVPRIALGPAPVSGAVNLAYYKLPDIAAPGCIAAHTMPNAAYRDELLFMQPNPAGYLCSESSGVEHTALWADITNVFADDGTPLFYVYVCKKTTPSRTDSGISVYIKGALGWPGDKKYLISIKEEGSGGRIYVYTNFLRDDDYVISYITLNDAGELATIEEPLYPLPVAIPGRAAGAGGVRYDIEPGSSFGGIRIRTNDSVVRDTRRPVPFKYRIKAEITHKDGSRETVWSPQHTETVLSESSLLPIDPPVYTNGRKVLHGGARVAEIMNPYIKDRVDKEKVAVIRYTPVCESEFVTVTCRPDGEGPLYASTDIDTGRAPDVIQNKGHRWRYVEYSSDNLEELGIKGLTRIIRIAAVITSPSGSVISHTEYSTSSAVGFGSTYIDINIPDLGNYAGDDILRFEVVNAPPGIDLTLIVNGEEYVSDDGSLSIPVARARESQSLKILVTEVYRPGCFVKQYAVRLYRTIPLEIEVPDAGINSAWPIKVRNGLYLRRGERDTEYTAYRPAGEERLEDITEVQPLLLDKTTVKLGYGPAVCTYDSQGRPLGISVTSAEGTIGVEWVDVLNNKVGLASSVQGRSGLSISYTRRVDWVEYSGYGNERFNLNPRHGAVDYKGNTYHPLSLQGEQIYIYLKPAARLSSLKRIYGEELGIKGITREGHSLVLLLTSRYPVLETEPVSIYYLDSGVEVPYGTGAGTYFTLKGDGTIAIYNPEIELDPVGRVNTRFAASYSSAGEFSIVDTCSDRHYIIHSLEPLDNSDYLLLGIITPGYTKRPEDAEVLDARRRGGGVADEILADAARLEPESRHYFDIGYWGGEPWQRDGAVMVRLPGFIRDRLPAGVIDKQVALRKPAGVVLIKDYWPGDDRYPDRPGRPLLTTAEDSSPGLAAPQGLTLAAVLE